jgi:hypothetical protein
MLKALENIIIDPQACRKQAAASYNGCYFIVV